MVANNREDTMGGGGPILGLDSESEVTWLC